MWEGHCRERLHLFVCVCVCEGWRWWWGGWRQWTVEELGTPHAKLCVCGCVCVCRTGLRVWTIQNPGPRTHHQPPPPPPLSPPSTRLIPLRNLPFSLLKAGETMEGGEVGRRRRRGGE